MRESANAILVASRKRKKGGATGQSTEWGGGGKKRRARKNIIGWNFHKAEKEETNILHWESAATCSNTAKSKGERRERIGDQGSVCRCTCLENDATLPWCGVPPRHDKRNLEVSKTTQRGGKEKRKVEREKTRLG